MPRDHSSITHEAELSSAIQTWHRGESLSAREQALIEEAQFQTFRRVLMSDMKAPLSASDHR